VKQLRKTFFLCMVLLPTSWGMDKTTVQQLIDMANSQSFALQKAITSTFDPKDLKDGTAWIGRGSDFFFAVDAKSQPLLFIDDAAGPDMKHAAGSNLWYAAAHIEPTGRLHSFHYTLEGARLGGRLDMPAYGPLSYRQPGVPSGLLSAKITHSSKIYDGMKSQYSVYVPAQYDPKIPAALMVFQDGSWYTDRNGWYTGSNGNIPIIDAIDNLIAKKKIPVMICVFIDPGDITDSPGTQTYAFAKAYAEKWHRKLKDSMRSTLYDTVSDRYPRFLRDEILVEVESKYNIRKDAYSRAIAGQSSGGICSFNAAWWMPELFSRVISWIGSFESIQWKENNNAPDGGQDYPNKILRERKRNIRVWLQDGSNDAENEEYGSWPLANLRMANALKMKGYDFHFSFGKGTHNPAHGAAEFPQEMIWLWRDYDPNKTDQTFTTDPSEAVEPVFRVQVINRNFE